MRIPATGPGRSLQLSTKLTLWLALTSAIILGAYGYVHLRQEEQDLRRTAEHDLRLLGTAVQVAVENSVRDHQTADVREILEALEIRDSAVDVLVFDDANQLQANSWGSGASVALVRDTVRTANETQRGTTYFSGPGGLARLIGLFPMKADDGSRLGVLAVVWPLDELRHKLDATARVSILSILTLIAGITAVGSLLGHVFVRRPLRTLVTAMQAVEAGNWVTRVPPHSGDEVGAAFVEFNAMVHELEHAREDLDRATEERERLEAALQRLDKLATLGQLSAQLAHEIGSPLQILNGRARGIARRPNLPPDVVRSAHIIDEQSDRIARIVEQLLHLTRPKPPQMAEVNVRTAVERIVDVMEPEARRRGLALEFECAEPLPAIVADFDRLQQVTMNLLSNALRATASGRVRVKIEAGARDRADGTGKIHGVGISVEDSGVGMSGETADRIFDPFFTTWREHGGTGLGLAIVKAIVAEHHGDVRVSSELGHGTRVCVWLPVIPSADSVAVA